MKLLVVIASYGDKNLDFLRQIVKVYQAMALVVDVVVVSDRPKSLPAGVRVVVGLPSSNPWSLPFAHKYVFAENIDRYDLFIYSEDDIGVTEGNVRAFLHATQILRDDELAGFMRYEQDASGSVWMPDALGAFRWKPESVIARNGRIFAEYTNEHAAFYVLTKSQLRRAIASGGFMRAPYEGRYDMLCSAATDPYTSCGFRKVVCISHLDEFLVHHMSNRYVGQMGLPLTYFRDQIETLTRIFDGAHPASTLLDPPSEAQLVEWSKALYDAPEEPVLSMVPVHARSILSIACGWGATEAELIRRGCDVTVIPVDSVIGAMAARRGVHVIYGTLDEGFLKLKGSTFDCLLVSMFLHLTPSPEALFSRCVDFMADNGSIVIASPNFDRLGTFLGRTLGLRRYRRLRAFNESGVSVLGPGRLARAAADAGLSDTSVRWYCHSLPRSTGLRGVSLRLGRITARSWVFRATRA